MKKNNQKYLIFLVLFFSILSFLPKLLANEKINFLSLKNNEVNLRQGPSFKYPIKLTYNKKYLPVIILDKSETWRKISDFESNSGWIHISQLSKKKSAINIKNNSILYKKSTIYTKPIATLEIGDTLCGHILIVDGLKLTFRKVKLNKRLDCHCNEKKK